MPTATKTKGHAMAASVATPAKPKPREVVLLTCPDPSCRKVSRIDATAFKGTKGAAYCTGPIGEGHKKVRCVPTTFREVENDG